MIWSCGSNGCGQLGLGHDKDVNVLTPCEFSGGVLGLVRDIKCGGNHTLVLFNNGDCWASGDNGFGQCGHDGPLTTKFIKLNGKWGSIACGWEFSILVDDHSNVWSCGYGSKGELGRGKEVVISTLEKVGFFGNVSAVDACMNHVVVLMKNGKKYGWGVSRKGQLGIDTKVVYSPQVLPLPVGVVSLGREFTLVSNNNRLFKFGKFDFQLPDVAAEIQTMWSSVHLMDKRVITGVGNNSHGQIVEKRNVDMFVTGSEHGIFLADDGVFTWGWGEHGNCGVLQDGVVSTGTRIGDSEGVVGIYGGLATTWVVRDSSTDS